MCVTDLYRLWLNKNSNHICDCRYIDYGNIFIKNFSGLICDNLNSGVIRGCSKHLNKRQVTTINSVKIIAYKNRKTMVTLEVHI